MPTPEFVSEHALGRTAVEGDARLVGFLLPESNENVSYFSDEVTSFCPVTGQPDFYEVTIDLYGSQIGIESKSLKLYLQSFNSPEKGQFAEAFADTILKEVLALVVTDEYEPGQVNVTVKQKSRGGISITAASYWAS